jgi:hypothetical protein
MKDSTIKRQIESLGGRLTRLKQQQEALLLSIKHVQEVCPHSDVKRWTNNDGDGQFIVERCNVCGLQKDGGLRPSTY